MKARHATDAIRLIDIPNIGPAVAEKLGMLGIREPRHLMKKNPYRLYKKLCVLTKERHDPCLLDVFMAATDFMNGAIPKEWWRYTKARKTAYPRL